MPVPSTGRRTDATSVPTRNLARLGPGQHHLLEPAPPPAVDVMRHPLLDASRSPTGTVRSDRAPPSRYPRRAHPSENVHAHTSQRHSPPGSSDRKTKILSKTPSACFAPTTDRGLTSTDRGEPWRGRYCSELALTSMAGKGTRPSPRRTRVAAHNSGPACPSPPSIITRTDESHHQRPVPANDDDDDVAPASLP
jgi:hypothetical protein